MTSPLHIGIVACSAEGAALCYRTICAEGSGILGDHSHPEVSLHSAPFSGYVDFLNAGDLDGVASLMIDSAEKLSATGADFLICPDNTIHQAFDRVQAASPLPWLHIGQVVAEEAVAKGYRCVGITGTKWLVSSDVYPEQLDLAGLEWVLPTDTERDKIDKLIMEELVYGVFRHDAVEYFQSVISHFKERGCDAVVLGCTEIPLIINDDNSELPTLDSTRLLARAALGKATEGLR